MNIGKLFGYIVAAILIFFGVLYILGAGGTNGGGVTWILTGIIIIAIGFGIIWLVSRLPSAGSGQAAQNVTLNIDLPAGVTMEKFTCTNCGNPIKSDDIKMVAGTPTVHCPYCGQIYQLTEEPKW